MTLPLDSQNSLSAAPSAISGWVDWAASGKICGWAADMSCPDAPVEIEFYREGELLTSCMADAFRQDLLEAGFGNGRHAFSCTLPHAAARFAPLELTARIKGTDVDLPHGSTGKTVFEAEPPPLLKYIAADIVDNCNLRCPFCVVDYSQVKKTQWVSAETFQRLLSLAPLVPEEGFWLSCLHEPTLHPRLNELIRMIPENARSKFWFTTNLARPLPVADFHGWAESGLHHINVSLDTMQPGLFAILRKFGKYEIFKRNLDRMAEVFSKYPDPPKLRFITMAFRSNFDEIPGIVEHSHRHWRSFENEIRYTYNVAHITDDFRKEHYLHKEDWPVLDERLARLPYRHLISYPPGEDYEDTVQLAANAFDLLGITGQRTKTRFEYPIFLRARPDGTLLLGGSEFEWSVNINELPDPPAFFRSL